VCHRPTSELVRKDHTLSDGELKYPKWQAQFQDAILERDPEALIEKIQKFEAAVFVRLQELSSDSDHHGEREAIADAVSTVRVVKKEKLFYPDWKLNETRRN
jgi:hypothetical protein